MASIDPSLWGPSFWATLHWTAAAYPPDPTDDDKFHYKTLYETLQFTLPCRECRQHFSELLEEMPVDPFLGSGKQLRQWVTSVHNAVNSRTQSAQRWTLSQVDMRFPPAVPSDSTSAVATVKTPLVSVAPAPSAVPVPGAVAPQNGKSVYALNVPRLPVSSAKLEMLRRQRDELVQHNNARSMGRVGRPAISAVRRYTAVAPAAAAATSSVLLAKPPKKKGCGCNKRK